MHSREEVGFGPDVTEAPEMPPGDHPLEVAARKGRGPLSAAGRSAWHGDCEPCVSCGQLVHRGAEECDSCGQDLSPQMRQRMTDAAGPWFVFEHVRPFPGISFERLVRQARKGVLSATSIVRGPTTEYQWRYAGETPALSKHLGLCWHCGEMVAATEVYCPGCLSHLDGSPQAAPLTETVVASMHLPPPAMRSEPVQLAALAQRGPQAEASKPGRGQVSPPRQFAAAAPDAYARPNPAPAPPRMSEELRALSAVLAKTERPGSEAVVDEPARIGGIRATWLIFFLFVALFGGLVGVIKMRERQQRTPHVQHTSEPAAAPDPTPELPPTPSDSP